MWVQLRSVKHIDQPGHPGKRQRYNPGDWVVVGEQLAMTWIGDGSAWLPPERVKELISSDCGVVIRGNPHPHSMKALEANERLEVSRSTEPALPYPMTLLWHPSTPLKAELIPVGFALLQTWQVAVPLWDYDILASQVGDEDDRERTKAVVRDLRVPLYDTNLIYVRRSGDTRRLVDVWREEMNGGDERLAFLRALYQVKPLILSLPITWSGKQGPPEH